MKVREVMSSNPVCCLPTDTAEKVAKTLRERDIGSIPVVVNQQTRRLIGMITDRDLCCAVVADGLDPKRTAIEKFVTTNPVSCRDGENLEHCERAMREHRVRRIPIVDGDGAVIGIVAQADLVLKLKETPERASETVAAISKPSKAA
jgi:CBS domain-containing protein